MLYCDLTGKVDEKATQLHAIASLKVLLDATKPQRGSATSTAASNVRMNYKETTLVADRPNGNIDTTLETVCFSKCFDKNKRKLDTNEKALSFIQ